MKKLFAAAMVMTLFSTFAMSVNSQTVELEKGYISVNKSTTIEVSPNQAEISIGVETSDNSVKKASEDNKIAANKVYSALKPLLGKDDYIKTGNYSIRPQYIYTKDNKKILDKYIVSNIVTVKTKNTQIISKLIDAAIAQGATKINDLQFSAVDYDNDCNAIMSDLTKKAYLQASTVAKSINTQITGVKSINTTCNPENTPRPYYAMMAKGEGDNASSTPIEAGKIKIYANIDASFYVK